MSSSNIHIELKTWRYEQKRLDRFIEYLKKNYTVLDVFKYVSYNNRKYSICTVLLKGQESEKQNEWTIELLREHTEIADIHDTRHDKWTLNVGSRGTKKKEVMREE